MQPAEVPVYDYVTCTHLAEKRRITPADVVLFEGVLALHFQQLAPLLNLKVYVDVDDDTRLARRCDNRCQPYAVAASILQPTTAFSAMSARGGGL